MDLNSNSIAFLNKLSNSLQLDIQKVHELFKDGTNVDCFFKIEENKIVELNVRGLAHAKSKLLKESEIIENVTILDANQIDLSDLMDLENLDFSSRAGNDCGIESYSFKYYPKMKYLIFRFHKTKSIYTSSCKELKYLDCSSNILEKLDASQNLQLEHLNCQLNPLTYLNISANENLIYLLANSTQLTNENLEFPLNNCLSTLHLRNTKFNKFDSLKFPKLTILTISGLNQDVFDTSLNKDLLKLHITDSSIKRVNIKESKFLSDFECQGSNFEEISCNEFQACSIPVLSKIFGLKPTPEQSTVIETLKLHKQAAMHNWDEGLSKLKLILKTKNCDLATAAMIYWMANPSYYLKYSKVSEVQEHEKEDYRFINKLEKQLLNQEFETNIIDFDPEKIMGVSINDNNFVREIPSNLKFKITGKIINEFDYNKQYTGKL